MHKHIIAFASVTYAGKAKSKLLYFSRLHSHCFLPLLVSKRAFLSPKPFVELVGREFVEMPSRAKSSHATCARMVVRIARFAIGISLDLGS